MDTSTITLAVIAVLILIALGFFLHFVPIGLWITALFSGVRVGMGTLIGMRLRKVNPADIVRPYISASKAGLDLDVGQMEAHYLAGGNVGRVVTALISADRANIDLPWQRATAIDLAGRDVLEAVQVSVNPKVIQTPRVVAVAKDGIQVIAVARVTVRANIERLVGGAGEGMFHGYRHHHAGRYCGIDPHRSGVLFALRADWTLDYRALLRSAGRHGYADRDAAA